MDWLAYQPRVLYDQCVRNAKIVAEHTSNMVDALVTYGGLNVKDLMLIGHSLGGQMIGHVGMYCQQLHGYKIGKIVSK